MDPSITGAIIGAVATLLAGTFVFFANKSKQPIGLEELLKSFSKQPLPSEADVREGEDFQRGPERLVEEKSHWRFIYSLPDLRSVVMENAHLGWDTGVTPQMRMASYDVANFLQYVWLRLADFYPSHHWDGKCAQAYITDFIKGRYSFHWAKHERGGPGTGGTIAGVLTGGDVISDLESLIEDTVSSLFAGDHEFNLEQWRQDWKGKQKQG